MNTSKYAKLENCSTDTALRDIQNLKIRGFFIQNPGSWPDEVPASIYHMRFHNAKSGKLDEDQQTPRHLL